MSIWQAIVLGIVQGVTEFLPISSSAHLVIVPWLLGWESPGLAFDAALHLGTLTAVLVYFWRDLLGMALAFPRAVRSPRVVLTSRDPADATPRLALLIAIGTVPGVAAGLLGQDLIEARYYAAGITPDAAIAAIAIAMIALALLLFWAEKAASHVRRLADLTVADGAIIGLAQAAALIPGISRSGATITAALFRGVARADAARFSFLLGTPIVAAAGVKGLLDTVTSGLDAGELSVCAVGLATSALAGFAAIAWLLRYLQRATTLVFIAYRVGLGILLLLLLVAR